MEDAMPRVEPEVKTQFEQIFKSSDWKLFKRIAEVNLREAAYLRSSDMRADATIQLLARNTRKRLLIGVGVELLLKAVYLKLGYVINKPAANTPTFPFTFDAIPAESLSKDRTVMLNELVQKLPTVLALTDRAPTMKGLQIAKVFRNKEGHCVTRSHAFVAENYTDIAASLRLLYGDAFGEQLTVRFSVAQGERAAWQLA
jgi:hypothetical protein